MTISFQNLQNIQTQVRPDDLIALSRKSGNQEYVTASVGFQEKTIRFLNKLPIFGRIFDSSVKSYGIRNLEVLKQLNATLQQRYSKDGVRQAFLSTLKVDVDRLDKTSLHKIPPITGRNISAMNQVAATFHGRGKAKNLETHVVVRIWPFHSQSRPGHASLSVKGMNEKTHISWWPGQKVVKGFSGLNPRKEASPPVSYREDKYLELGEKTREKLKSGEFNPLPGQNKINISENDKYAGEWGFSAQKVYLPMHGLTVPKGGKKSQQVLFGLSQDDISSAWKKVSQDKNAYYQFVSKDHNCAGMVKQMLVAGGAELFLKVPQASVYSDPNTVHSYVIGLEKEVSRYNDRLDELLQSRDNALQKNQLPNLVTEEKLWGSSLTDLQKHFQKVVSDAKLPSAEQKICGDLIKAVGKIAVSNDFDMPGIQRMTMAKSLVDAIDTLESAQLAGKQNQSGTTDRLDQVKQAGIAILARLKRVTY